MKVSISTFESEGMKKNVPSNLTDNWTTLETIRGIKLSGHFDTFTEVSNLIDEMNKRDEI